MAPDSKMLIGLPPGPSLSMIAGILLFGLILRPLGVFQVHNSMLIGDGLLFATGADGRQHYRDGPQSQAAIDWPGTNRTDERAWAGSRNWTSCANASGRFASLAGPSGSSASTTPAS